MLCAELQEFETNSLKKKKPQKNTIVPTLYFIKCLILVLTAFAAPLEQWRPAVASSVHLLFHSEDSCSTAASI